MPAPSFKCLILQPECTEIRIPAQAIGQYNLQPQRSNIGQVSTQGSRQTDYPGRAPLGPQSSNVGSTSSSTALAGPYPSYPPGSRAGYQSGPGPAVGTANIAGMTGIAGSSLGGVQSSYGPQTSLSSNQSQQYPHQPLIGRMASSSTSSGVVGRISPSSQQLQQSPFGPASTGVPGIPSRGQARFTGKCTPYEASSLVLPLK